MIYSFEQKYEFNKSNQNINSLKQKYKHFYRQLIDYEMNVWISKFYNLLEKLPKQR